MVVFLDDLKNRFDFFLRNHLTFSRKNYNEKADNLNSLIHEDNKHYFINLQKSYDLEFLKPSAKRIFLENLYFLNLFNEYFSKSIKQNAYILDIGSKNWSYVKSEHLFFKSFCQNFTLNGIEIDPYRVCSNLYNRFEIAKFYTKGLANTNYIAGDLIQHQKKYDYIIWILPFITQKPLLKWGLPLKYFKPDKMLLHAYDLLNENGEMIIVNQGEEEYKIQKDLNSRLNLQAQYFGEIEDNFNLFKNKRYCSKIIKTTV